MESIVKKATIRINKIIYKYNFDYLLSICSTKYLLFIPYTHQELMMAEKDLTYQIKNRLSILYKLFGKELLTLWGCPILTNNDFNNLSLEQKINLIVHYSNNLTDVLQKIYNEFIKNKK